MDCVTGRFPWISVPPELAYIYSSIRSKIKLDTKMESIDMFFKQSYGGIFIAVGAHLPARIGIDTQITRLHG